MAEQILSIVEYARAFQLSDMTVRRRIKTGRLQAFLQDGKYYIPVQSGAAASAHETQPHAPTVEPYYPEVTTRPPPPSQHRGQQEMQLIKANAPAAKSYQQPAAPSAPRQLQHRPSSQHLGASAHTSTPHAANHMAQELSGGAIPATLSRPLLTHETSLVDTRALLAFCEASLKKVQESERRQVEKFKARLEALEATLAQRDAEAQGLRQQVEDLQLLVKVMERKKTGA